ncbi:MAG: response regulator transcription factor [Thermoflexales bacterium]|nr:response regulator transcription factor [Thermoflexales bacterium]
MVNQARILIVDDEEAIRFFLSEELSQAGYTVLTAGGGEEALVLLQREPIDLVLLDLKMGGISGLQVMEEIEKRPMPPVVIMLTAHASLDSAVGAMRRGGFDYLKKPCRPEDLLTSVEKGLAKRREAIQRQQMIHLIEETARQLEAPARSEKAASRPVIHSPLASRPRFLEGRGLLLDLERETVTLAGKPLPLTQSEFRLLACLMENAGQPVSYSQLVEALHGDKGGEWEDWEERQAISTHLWRLRRKLSHGPDGRPYVVNMRGRGYKFAV